MELAELQRHWNAYGEIDPLWAILSDPEKRWNRWDLGEFFQNGRTQIAGLMDKLRELGLSVARGTALDFGCGIGRLTQALCEHFDTCTGVDIAPSMIEQARKYNRFGDRARYVVNDRSDLGVFPNNTFDLIYSIIVLQHMEPRYSTRYIGEFVRTVKPGGLVVFQIPGGPRPKDMAVAEFPDDVLDHPLPPDGFRVWLRAESPPAILAARANFLLPVRVRNISAVRWPRYGLADTQFGLRLGVRWYDEHGTWLEHLRQERLYLDRSLSPGEETTVTLSVTAPPAPGRYLLEVDMAQEWVGWFKDKGGRCTSVGVEVIDSPAVAATGASSDPGFEPEIQMHSVPKDEVLAVITSAGGRVLHVESVNTSATYLDYNYYVTK